MAKEKTLIAHCDSAGVVRFSETCPDGSLPIGEVKIINVQRLLAHCRLAYDGQTWLVPGIPEAPDKLAGVDALRSFVNRLTKLGIVT